MYATHENKLPGRVTSANTANKADAVISAAQSSLEGFRKTTEAREEVAKHLDKIPEKVREVLLANTFNVSNATDDFRVKTCEAVLGIQGAVIEGLRAFKRESFLTMDDKQCAEALRHAVELRKMFPQFFPITGK